MEMISVDDLIEYCDSERAAYKANNCGAACTALRRVAEFAKEYAIEAELVKHAHWIKGHCGADEYIKCSVCRTKTVNAIVSLEGDAAEKYFDLCPYCGAEMDGDNDD